MRLAESKKQLQSVNLRAVFVPVICCDNKQATFFFTFKFPTDIQRKLLSFRKNKKLRSRWVVSSSFCVAILIRGLAAVGAISELTLVR
jgi:hypothetical protein